MSVSMARELFNLDGKWYFTAAELEKSPSRKHGIDMNKELDYRQKTAIIIQKLGGDLKLSDICINNALIYMHRFFVFHSFADFDINIMAAACTLLAGKSTESNLRMETLLISIKACFPHCYSSIKGNYNDIILTEEIILQTLGFNTHVILADIFIMKTYKQVKAPKKLVETALLIAKRSLQLTTMCLRYKPSIIAGLCICLSCKWNNTEIPKTDEGKYWFQIFGENFTKQFLAQLTEEFLAIYEQKKDLIIKESLSQKEPLVNPQKSQLHQDQSAKNYLTFLLKIQNKKSVLILECKKFCNQLTRIW